MSVTHDQHGNGREAAPSAADTSRVVSRSSAELYREFAPMLLALARANGVRSVAELGGGANPLLADEEAWGFADTRMIFDISTTEMDKADPGLSKHQADLCRPLPTELHGRFGLVFSKMLCEHLPDPETFHRNCYQLLAPGGLSVHFFPTLYAAPFLFNWVVPESVSRRVVSLVQPKRLDDPHLEKFPAYYRWCTGPTPRSLQRFEDLGFEVERWFGGYGHSYYDKVPPLATLEHLKSQRLIAKPVPALTAFAIVVLRKPYDA